MALKNSRKRQAFERQIRGFLERTGDTRKKRMWCPECKHPSSAEDIAEEARRGESMAERIVRTDTLSI